MWIVWGQREALGERVQDQFMFHLVNWGWGFKTWGIPLPILWSQLIFQLHYLLFPTCTLYTFVLGNGLCFVTTNFLIILFLLHIKYSHSILETFLLQVSSIKTLLITTTAATTLTFTIYSNHMLSPFSENLM